MPCGSKFEEPEMLEALKALEQGDYSTAFILFARLAEAGNPKAQCNLATLYHTGCGVQVDAKKAVELYLKVAEQQILEEHLSAIAYNNLSTIYSCGLDDILADPQKAGEYRRRARTLGFEM